MRKISRVRIFIDSYTDLPKGWIKKYNLGIIPSYKVSQAPQLNDLVQMFSPIISKGKDILYISVLPKQCSTYQTALLAANEFPESRVSIVDSINVLPILALSVVLATQKLNEAMSSLNIADWLKTVHQEIKLDALINNSHYHYKNRKEINFRYLLCRMFRTRRTLHVNNGYLFLGMKYIGRKNNIAKRFLKKLLTDIHRIDHDHLIIVHTFEEELARWMQKFILAETNIREVLVVEGGVLTCNQLGSHNFAISYILNSSPLSMSSPKLS
ncbi:DegV family protein [Paenibacillus illinoisensis]|uniref:DegV family protein n=1 Tax=Paenibacillus illinoisensis TaxID=59845 RepID=UPI00301A697E